MSRLNVSKAVLAAMAIANIPQPVEEPSDAVVGWFPFILPTTFGAGAGDEVNLKAATVFGSQAVVRKLLGSTYPGTTPELWAVFTDCAIVADLGLDAAGNSAVEVLDGIASWTLESDRGGIRRIRDVGPAVRGVAGGYSTGAVDGTGTITAWDLRALSNPLPLGGGLAVNFKSDSLILRAGTQMGADIRGGTLWLKGIVGKNPDFVLGQMGDGCAADVSTDDAARAAAGRERVKPTS